MTTHTANITNASAVTTHDTSSHKHNRASTDVRFVGLNVEGRRDSVRHENYE